MPADAAGRDPDAGRDRAWRRWSAVAGYDEPLAWGRRAMAGHG